MAVRYFVDDTTNVLLSVTEFDAQATPTGQTAVAKSTIEAAYTEDIYLGGTWDGTTYTPPAGQIAVPTDLEVDLRALHNAYVHYHTAVRKQGWISLGGTSSEEALKATDIWIYQQVALGDQIAREAWSAITTDARKDAALNHLITSIRSIGYIWYSVMNGNGGLRASWASAAIADGSALYSDLVVASGAGVGDVRSADGTFGLLNPVVTIATNFEPENTNLRST